jgi:hypothetical protein
MSGNPLPAKFQTVFLRSDMGHILSCNNSCFNIYESTVLLRTSLGYRVVVSCGVITAQIFDALAGLLLNDLFSHLDGVFIALAAIK